MPARRGIPWRGICPYALAMTLVLAAGCHRARAGAACAAGTAPRCDGANAALDCRGGTWQRVSCGGGCDGEGEDLECLPDEVVEGAPCLGGDQLGDEGSMGSYGCGRGGTWLAECRGGKWRRSRSCRCATRVHRAFASTTTYVVCE